MFVATATVSVILAALLVYAAVRKLSHRPDVVASYTRVGVPEHRLNLLAAVLLAGAAGLLAGLYWAPIGIAAAIGLVIYFLLAVGAHIHTRDTANLGTPVVLVVLSAAAFVLRWLSL